jgi:hypothetical protein
LAISSARVRVNLRDVALDRDRVAAVGLDLLDDGLGGLLGGAVVDGDGRAVGGGVRGDPATGPPGGAGDETGLSVDHITQLTG